MSNNNSIKQSRVFTKPFGIVHYLRTLSRITLVKTPDEFRVLNTLYALFKPVMLQRTWLWHPRVGEFPLRPFVTKTKKKLTTLDEDLGMHAFYSATRGVNYDCNLPEFKSSSDTLATFFKEEPRDDQNFLIVLDPDLGWFNDPMVVRQLLDFANYTAHDNRWVSMVVLIGGPDTEAPNRLKPYINVVVDDDPLEPGFISQQIEDILKQIKVDARPEALAELMAGHVRTMAEVDQVIASTIITAKSITAVQKMDTDILVTALKLTLEARYED